MGFFSRFPYSDFHRLNADWILEKIQEMLGLTQDAAEDAEAAAETVAGYESRLSQVEGIAEGSVLFDTAQDLTDVQRAQARGNIGAASTAQFISLGEGQAALRTRATNLENNSVRVDTVQTFSADQKQQARDNIGAASASAVPTGAVLYDAVQTLTSEEKAQARSNISAADTADVNLLTTALGTVSTDVNRIAPKADGAVRFDASQSLSTAQQQQARDNIGAASASAVLSGAVLYSAAQTLTSLEMSQARSNIHAPDRDAVLPATDPVASLSLGIMDDSVAQDDGDEITISLDSLRDHSILKLTGSQSQTVRLSGLAAPSEDDEAVNLGFADTRYEPRWSVVSVSGSTPTISPEDHCIYECGECSTLTIQTPLPEAFVVTFDSGSTPTVLTLPAAVNMQASFTVEANTHNEINIRKGYGLGASWEVTPNV